MKSIQNKTTNTRVFLSIELLKTFSLKELNAFKLFIANRYINTDADLPVLLKQLMRHVLKVDKFTPELQLKIYVKLFGEIDRKQTTLKKKESGLLVNKLNKLLHLAEKFLMFKTIKDTDDFNTTLLFPELINRNQTMLYRRRLKATEKKLATEKKRGIDYHTKCYLTQKEKARLLFLNNALAKEDNYDAFQYHTDIKYLLEKLHFHLAKITMQRRYTHKTFNFKPFAALQVLLNLPQYQTNPLIQLYVLNIQLVETEEETIFLALLKLLKDKQDFIPSDILKPFYTNLTNHCVYQLAKGDLNYLNYMFQIYNNMHSANIIVANNSIDIILLRNIITIACQVNEIDWATNILANYIKYVPKKVEKSVLEYNNGIIAFNKTKYIKALNHFNKVKKIDDAHDLDLRIVQLQIYYETDMIYETGTQQMIDSLKSYLHQNKKLTKRQKTAYINFISVFNKLYKFKDIVDNRSKRIVIKKKLPKLKANILQFESLKKKQWLLSKIKILEKNIINN